MAFPSLDRNVHVHEKIFRQVCTANAIPTRIANSLILTLRLFEIHIRSHDNLGDGTWHVDHVLNADNARFQVSKIAGPAKQCPAMGLLRERETYLRG